MRAHIRALAIALAVFSTCLNSALGSGGKVSPDVEAALSSLESWLGDGTNGKRWGEYLNLPALHAELAKGDRADPGVVNGVVGRLDSGAAGLDKPRFGQLRDALVSWSQELTIAQAPDLSAVAVEFEGKFQPADPATVTKAKAELESAVAKLDKYLTAGGANGEAWKAYLQWPVLEAQLQAETPDVEALGTVYERLTRDQVGLELPVFANVATAIDHYASALAATSPDAKASFAEQLKSLAEELKTYPEKYSEDLALVMGARLGFFDRVRQAGALVRAIRRRYSKPNLFVGASARLVGAGIEQAVDDDAPVRDYILGTSLSGTGHTIGKVSVELVPSEDGAVLETVLVGKTQTKMVGYNGPATIYTRGNVAISGRKRILFDETGFKSFPATGDADAKTQITGISARCRLVERIAERRAAAQHAEAERIGSQHAADRVAGRVESQAGDQLSKAHQQYVEKFRRPLLRRREFPSLLRFSTSKEALFVEALQANGRQLGAPGDAPTIEGIYDLVVRAHESLFNNFAAALLAGETIKEEEMQRTAIDLLGELPEKLKSEADRDPWSITFARVQPVSIKIADDGFVITIRGQRYTSGERDFRAMNVTAEYKASIDGNGSKFVRQGDLNIVPPNFVPGKSRLSTQQITLRTLLERRFGKLLEQEIKTDGLELPGQWEKAGRLDLKHQQLSGGWAALGWIESGESVKSKDKQPKDNVALANP